MPRFAIPLSALLLLAACQPANPLLPLRSDDQASSSASRASSSAPDDDSASGDVAVTLEPFAEPAAPATASGASPAVEQSVAAGTLVIGDDDAPLSIAVYLHPLSPYAREFQRSRVPALVDRFVRTGELAIQFVTLPIAKYGGADDAVRTTMCAMDQGKAYEAHVRMYRDGAATLDEDDQEELGLDPDLFATCVSTMTGDLLAGTRVKAAQEGVTLVPTYVIRGETFVGLPSEADLLGAVNAAL